VIEPQADDWDAVATAVSNRLSETRMTQMEVASKAKVSLTTIRELQHNLNPRKRRPQTLSAVSEALGWPPGYLAQVLHGEDAQPHADESADPALTVLARLEREVAALRDRVERIERWQAAGDAAP
jgi:hypothetical protein